MRRGYLQLVWNVVHRQVVVSLITLLGTTFVSTAQKYADLYRCEAAGPFSSQHALLDRTAQVVRAFALRAQAAVPAPQMRPPVPAMLATTALDQARASRATVNEAFLFPVPLPL